VIGATVELSARTRGFSSNRNAPSREARGAANYAGGSLDDLEATSRSAKVAQFRVTELPLRPDSCVIHPYQPSRSAKVAQFRVTELPLRPESRSSFELL